MLARGLSRLFALPPYAETGHPAARLGYTPPLAVPIGVRLIRAFAHFVLVALILAVGLVRGWPALHAAASSAAGVRFPEAAYTVLETPNLIMALIVVAFAWLYGARAAAILFSGPAFDALRTTPNGVRLALLAYHAGVVRALWRPLLLLLLIRAVVIGGLLVDLASHQGRALDLYLLGVVPTLDPAVGLIALVIGLTAALILPLALVLLACGAGMALALIVRARVAVMVITVTLLAVYVTSAGGILLTRSNLLAWLTGPAYDPAGLVTAVIGGGLADHGYMLLHLGRTAAFWAALPYGVAIGGALLVLAFAAVAIGEGLVRYAAARAGRAR